MVASVLAAEAHGQVRRSEAAKVGLNENGQPFRRKAHVLGRESIQSAAVAHGPSTEVIAHSQTDAEQAVGADGHSVLEVSAPEVALQEHLAVLQHGQRRPWRLSVRRRGEQLVDLRQPGGILATRWALSWPCHVDPPRVSRDITTDSRDITTDSRGGSGTTSVDGIHPADMKPRTGGTERV